MTDLDKQIRERVDTAIAEAKARLYAAPEQATQFAIKLIPPAGERIRLYILAGVLVAGLLAFVFKPSPKPPTPGFQQPPELPGLAKVPKITIKGPIQVYPPGAGPTLPPGTPESTKITTSADLKPTEGGYHAVATYDTATGETKILAEEQPRPWFQLGGKTEVGVRALLATGGGQEGQVYTRQDLLRIGSVHTAVYGDASINTNPTVKPAAKVGVEISYRF